MISYGCLDKQRQCAHISGKKKCMLDKPQIGKIYKR